MVLTWWIVDAGIDGEGDPNAYSLAIIAPDESDAYGVFCAFGRDPERIRGYDEDDRWNLVGAWNKPPFEAEYGAWCWLVHDGTDECGYTVLDDAVVDRICRLIEQGGPLPLELETA